MRGARVESMFSFCIDKTLIGDHYVSDDFGSVSGFLVGTLLFVNGYVHSTFIEASISESCRVGAIICLHSSEEDRCSPHVLAESDGVWVRRDYVFGSANLEASAAVRTDSGFDSDVTDAFDHVRATCFFFLNPDIDPARGDVLLAGDYRISSISSL